MAKIQIIRGQDGDGNASELHLIRNHLLDPTAGIDNVIHYAEQRYLMTLLVSGVTDSKYAAPGYIFDGSGDTVKSRIGTVPKGKLSKTLSYEYKIMGRIQKSSEIVALVGTPTAGSSTTGGYFNLRMATDELYPGMNVRFYNGKHARVMTRPTGGPGNWVYQFQCSAPGDTFVWATWVAVQPGTYTCFGGYSTYGERSLRGYGRVFYADTFINHMTTQRKGIGISGDANTEDVLWLELDGQKGWMYEAESQTRAQFNLEDDYAKTWGVSNMKDSNGNLISTPPHIDAETGEPLVAGDGWYEQINGSNNYETSAADGSAVYADLSDMMGALKKKSNQLYGKIYYAMTGSDGMANANTVITSRFSTTYQVNVNPKDVIGGFDMPVGFNFKTLDIDGNRIVFVENPQMDDEQKFPKRLANGKLRMSSTFYFMDMSPDQTGRPNMEILARGNNRGVNRSWVYFLKNGMTGDGPAQDAIDAKEFQMLKQDMLVIYNTRSCGILEPSATA